MSSGPGKAATSIVCTSSLPSLVVPATSGLVVVASTSAFAVVVGRRRSRVGRRGRRALASVGRSSTMTATAVSSRRKVTGGLEGKMPLGKGCYGPK